MNHGPLPEYLQSHPEVDRVDLLTTIADAIAHLRTLPNPILHGGNRGMNILVDGEGQPLLNSMGCSMILDAETGEFSPTIQAHGGNPLWTAPEKLRSSKYPLTLAADVYSFGCLMAEVFSGQVPFHHLRYDPAVFLEIIVRQRHPDRPPESHAKQLTDSLWELMKRCWSRDPPTRPSMREIHKCLILRVSSSLLN